MYMLHNATYDYVHTMEQWKDNYEMRNHTSGNEYSLSVGVEPDDLSFGSLNDPLEEYMGYQKIPIQALDAVSLVFPFAFMALAVLMDASGSFTKVMVCNICLAIGKGAFGYMTTVPDSAGWAVCQQRLGKEGVAFMSKDHTAFELLHAELFGITEGGVHNKHLRWCADMMWSGHTYLTCLYALGLYDLVKALSKDWSPSKRGVLLFFVGTLAVTEQALEVYLVLKNRFHYTMDVVMAILITFLFYTNGTVSMVADWWTNLYSKPVASMYTDGDVTVPPCCFPFSLCVDRGFIFETRKFTQALHMLEGVHEKEVSFTSEIMMVPKQVVDDVKRSQTRPGCADIVDTPAPARDEAPLRDKRSCKWIKTGTFTLFDEHHPLLRTI